MEMSALLKPFEVAACADAESAPTDFYVAAVASLPRVTRKYLDADDVRQVARILLASCAAGAHTPGDAAARAATRAAGRLSMQHADDTHAGSIAPAGDTLAMCADDDGIARASLARASFTAPDACAQWTTTDTLAALDALADGTLAPVVRTLRTDAAWKPEGINWSAVDRALGGTGKGGSRRATMRDVGALLADAASDAGTVAAWRHAPSAAPDRARDLDRDTSTPTSGPASYVVRTAPDGTRWLLLPDMSTRVTSEGAAAALAAVNVLPAVVTRHARAELDRAGKLAVWEASRVRPARRPCGVGVGVAYGFAGTVAPDTAPEPRPRASLRRKRDGGIGSPMVPA